jgi:hypothetical protein
MVMVLMVILLDEGREEAPARPSRGGSAIGASCPDR